MGASASLARVSHGLSAATCCAASCLRCACLVLEQGVQPSPSPCAARALTASRSLPLAMKSREKCGLAFAVEARDTARTAELLDAEVSVNARQPDGMTALHWAAYHDDAALGAKLLQLGAEADVRNRYGITPLYLACQNGNGELTAALLKAGADATGTIVGGETALMTAARTGRTEPVEALLQAGARVDARENAGKTALMWAAAEGNVAVVECLLKAGADHRIVLPRSGFTAFFFAVREGKTAVVERLLQAGADVNASMQPKQHNDDLPRRGTSPLMLAVENGHYDLAVALLEAGAHVNDVRTGYSVLHALTWIRRPDRGEGQAGDPAPQGSGRRTSLQFAEELIRRGAEVDFQLKQGRRGGGARVSQVGATALFMASDRADVTYMKLLVKYGADPGLANEDGTTALLVAAGNGSHAPEEEAGTEAECLAAVKYLVSLGVDINTVDKRGETAMHGAAYKNIPAVVRYLDSIGHDIGIWNKPNRAGRTPHQIAAGYRPGNFKPSFSTVAALEAIMRVRGVPIPELPKKKGGY